MLHERLEKKSAHKQEAPTHAFSFCAKVSNISVVSLQRKKKKKVAAMDYYFIFVLGGANLCAPPRWHRPFPLPYSIKSSILSRSVILYTFFRRSHRH